MSSMIIIIGSVLAILTVRKAADAIEHRHNTD
jgi:hypothetical protein